MPTLFNSVLAHKRKQLKAEFKRLLKSNNPEHRKLYRENLTKFSKECSKAKTNHWRQTTTELTEIKDVARVQKFFEGKIAKPIDSIRRPDGKFTSSEDETLTELMKFHLPQCSAYADNEDRDSDEYNPIPLNSLEIKQILNCTEIDKIKWAINSFLPFKSPGEDQIFPVCFRELMTSSLLSSKLYTDTV